MDIKRIQAAQPFQVNSATEANDDERRRELREKAEKSKYRKVASSVGAQPDATKQAGAETSELCRQIVDSEKVLQLLDMRPSNTASAKQKLLRLQSTKPLSAQQKKQKNINRAL